jgi:lipopolysaccharide export LptBFGC system permease protein LptF
VSNRPGRQRVRPLPKGNSLYTPDASPTRQAAERRSAKVLLFLHQLPTWVLPLVLVALLVAGLAVKGPGGAVALCGVAAVLGWLAAISWPRLASNGKLSRILGIAVVLALAGLQAAR